MSRMKKLFDVVVFWGFFSECTARTRSIQRFRFVKLSNGGEDKKKESRLSVSGFRSLFQQM